MTNLTGFATSDEFCAAAEEWAARLNADMQNRGRNLDDVLFTVGLYSSICGVYIDSDFCDLSSLDATLVSVEHGGHRLVVTHLMGHGWYVS